MSKKDKTVARQRPSPVAPSPSFPSNASFPLTSFSPGTGWFALSHVLCPRCPGGGALHILAASPAETPRYVSRPKQSDVQDPEISKTRPLSVLFRVETFPSLSWLLFSADHSSFRDFAYVARDRNSRRFMCHVFRCDTPARTIANTLRDICKRLMLQRRPNVLHALDSASVGGERRLTRESSLPTPIEEPKKVLRCHFLGVTQVPRATGIDILNDAVDRLVNQIRPERWILADVSIAPSTISINEVGGGQIAQCRVRYLSFLGIGSDIKHCAFIMHTSSDNFMCYVFHVEPSAGAMAKTIEAACKLRYQKVLDAHTAKSAAIANGKGWGESLREKFGSVRERLSTSSSRHSLSRV